MMNDRIPLPKLRAALRRRYGITPNLCCTQQPDADEVRFQTITWDCDYLAAIRTAPPEIWRQLPDVCGTMRLTDEFGQKWWVTEHADRTFHVGVHTLLDGEWKHTKKADQQAARVVARICKQLRRVTP